MWEVGSWRLARLLEWAPTGGEPGVNELAACPVDGAAAAGGGEGVRVVGGFNDGRVRVWDPARPAPEVTLAAHAGPVYSVLVVPDAAAGGGGEGGRLFSASQDIRVWSAEPAGPEA